MTASAATEWISAISAAALGLFGFIFTSWQWWASRFRPKASARVDGNREAIELRIVNRGRGSGLIHRVSVIDAEQLEVNSSVEGFEGDFTPVALPSFAAMSLIIMAPNSETFALGTRVKVDWWDGGQTIDPLHVDVGLYGLKSVLPPKG